jgi:hypothetical protein
MDSFIIISILVLGGAFFAFAKHHIKKEKEN